MAIPKKIAYSIPTVTDGVTAIDALELTVVDVDVIPNVAVNPAYAILCSDPAFSDPSANFETVLVTANSSGTLTIERAVEGAAREWASGTAIRFSGTYSAYQDLVTHMANNTNPHGAVSTATASRIIVRDADGRARVAAPSDNTDIARKLEVDARLALAGGTMIGAINFDGQKAQKSIIEDYVEALATATWNGATQSINLQSGNVHSVSITAAVTTLTFTNPRAGAHSFTLRLAQGGTLYAVTWPASVAWAGGDPPDMAIDKVYWITFATINSGTNWHGFLAGEV